MLWARRRSSSLSSTTSSMGSNSNTSSNNTMTAIQNLRRVNSHRKHQEPILEQMNVQFHLTIQPNKSKIQIKELKRIPEGNNRSSLDDTISTVSNTTTASLMSSSYYRRRSRSSSVSSDHTGFTSSSQSTSLSSSNHTAPISIDDPPVFLTDSNGALAVSSRTTSDVPHKKKCVRFYDYIIELEPTIAMIYKDEVSDIWYTANEILQMKQTLRSIYRERHLSINTDPDYMTAQNLIQSLFYPTQEIDCHPITIDTNDFLNKTLPHLDSMDTATEELLLLLQQYIIAVKILSYNNLRGVERMLYGKNSMNGKKSSLHVQRHLELVFDIQQRHRKLQDTSIIDSDDGYNENNNDDDDDDVATLIARACIASSKYATWYAQLIAQHVDRVVVNDDDDTSPPPPPPPTFENIVTQRFLNLQATTSNVTNGSVIDQYIEKPPTPFLDKGIFPISISNELEV